MSKESFSNCKTPVLLICFNRPQYIELQLEALRMVKPPVIYISRDGGRPGNPADNERTKEVKKLYLNGIDWDCKLTTRFLEENLGCFNGPKTAMQWFFEHEKEGIILEDDIIPGVDFFRFAQEMLEKYRDNKKIISISGCNFGYKGKEDGYFFCKIMNMWGWATWRDRFNEIDFSMSRWNTKKSNYFFLYRKLKNHFLDTDINWWIYLSNYFNKTKKGELITWDYQFIYHQLLKEQLTVYPGMNLIKNIGFNTDATHTIHKDNPIIRLEIEKLSWPLTTNNKLKNNKIFYENFLKVYWALYIRPNWKYYLGKLIKR